KPKEDGKTRHYILPVADYENDTEKLDVTFQKEIKRFTNSARTLLNRENIGVGEYRILPPRRKVELLQRIEMNPVKVIQMK
ncbi:MAG: hypothetical protein LBK97_00700, partial [Prevotellaceae bacterium]|nr:hypothetical protein [Prevotellaceae bacterium]